MACNTKDLCISFLYMESLRKRGLLDNTTQEMRTKMMDNALSKLKELSQDRDKILAHRNKLRGFPSVNFISKDYVNFVNFEEAYTTPLMKADGMIETIFDIDASKDISVLAKSEDTGSVFVPPVIGGELLPDYQDRDKAIVTLMTGKALYDEMSLMMKRSDNLVLFDLAPIEDKLEDANISKGEFLEIIEKAGFAMEGLTDAEVEAMRDEAYLPFRIDNKAILGEIYYKESLADTYAAKLSESIKNQLSEAPISDIEAMLETLFSHKSNREIIDSAVDAAQKESDAMMAILPEKVAASSLKDAKTDIKAQYRIQPEIREVLSETGKGIKFELDCISDARSIRLLPVGNKKEARVAYLDLFIVAPDKNDPAKFVKHPLQATNLTLKCNLGTDKSYVEIKELAPSGIEIPVNKERNVTKAKAYKIEADFPVQFDKEMFGQEMPNRRTMIIDEADQGAGGQAGDILTYITGKYGSKINVATGTPINGYPESSVNILKLGGNMSLESVQVAQAEFQRLYGVHSIESKFLTLLVHGMDSYSDLADMIKATYSSIKTKEKNKSESVNIDTLYENAVKDLANLLVEKQLFDKEMAMNMDVYKERVSTKIFFDAIEKTEKENRTLEFATVAKNALINTPALTKKVPKISSLQGFANTFMTVGGTVSVSSTDAGIKKDLIFVGAEQNHANFNKNNPEISYDRFVEGNRSGIRIVQGLLRQYATMRFTNEIYVTLTQNYINMFKMFTRNNTQGKALRELLLEEMHHEDESISLSQSELLTLMNKTTTSSNDSFADFYKSYLRNNGQVTSLVKDGDERQKMRLDVFRFTLKVFSRLVKILPAVSAKERELREKERFGKNKKNKGKEELEIKVPSLYGDAGSKKIYDFTGMTYKYMPTFIRGEKVYDVEERLIRHMGEFAYPTNEIFSVEIDLCPDDLKPFVRPNENGKRIPYRYELINKEENQILDVVGSLGVQQQIKEQILSGANVVNFSQRVFTNGIATLNYLSALNEVMQMYKADGLTEEQKHIVKNHIADNSRLIVNYTSDGGDRFDLKSLYENIIVQAGVEVLPTKREVLDSVTKKSVVYDNKNVSLYSHYRSVSRGFALDYMHKKVSLPNGEEKQVHTVLNFIDPVGGGDGIQALSRLESPKTDKNIVSLFNGGNDARLLFFGEQAEMILEKIIPTAGDEGADAFVLHQDLSEAISEIASMPKKESDTLLGNIIQTLDLPMPFGVTEISLNGRKAKMATETYNSVMEGKNVPLPDEEVETLYIKKPVIDLSMIPDGDDAEQKQDQSQLLETDKENEKIKSILADIDSELGIDLSGEPAHEAQMHRYP